MKLTPALLLLAAGLAGAQTRAPADPRLPLVLDEKLIREAVRETLAQNPDNARRHEADTLRGNKYQEFAEQFSEAKVPYCFRPDGLKHQPTNIGPIGFAGLYAAPFVVVAKLRGKCL
jgi:hypothetical protein